VRECGRMSDMNYRTRVQIRLSVGCAGDIPVWRCGRYICVDDMSV
jgi:hypothetical protein